ncbi:hypothetical protein V7150_20575 [Neobacillus drentensis]|uniref:hypothetical protein n=1 Tax=Neobacillus drentensis TaxID=220684 RepID=UPI002FFFC3A4
MIGYQCCFCGEDIESNEADVSSLILITNWDKEDNQDQQFFCHIECFKRRLAENVPVFLP